AQRDRKMKARAELAGLRQQAAKREESLREVFATNEVQLARQREAKCAAAEEDHRHCAAVKAEADAAAAKERQVKTFERSQRIAYAKLLREQAEENRLRREKQRQEALREKHFRPNSARG
ncbi:unnamed protein product, partial [Polarella glacialis]